MDFDPAIARSGRWLYAGSVPCAVQIVQRSLRPGTGDWEDPPEVANDVEGKFFELEYHTMVGTLPWVGGGYFETMEQASRKAEKLLGPTLEWAP